MTCWQDVWVQQVFIRKDEQHSKYKYKKNNWSSYVTSLRYDHVNISKDVALISFRKFLL